MAANLACTTFCHCQGGSICNNEQTRATEELDEEEKQLAFITVLNDEFVKKIVNIFSVLKFRNKNLNSAGLNTEI